MVQLLCEFIIGASKEIKLQNEALELFRINLAISYKRRITDEAMESKFRDLLSTIDEEDKSICLAKAILQSDFSLATTLFLELGKGDDNLYRGCFEWPLFDEYRSTELFRNAFKKIYGKDFDSIVETKRDKDSLID